MKARELVSRLLRLTIGETLSGTARIAITSRSRRKPEREGRRALDRHFFMLVLSVALLFNLSSIQFGFAKSTDRTEKIIAAKYSVNKSLEESDGTQIRRYLLRLLTKPDIKLFLDVIQKAEGGEPNLMVGGCRAASLKQHPALTLPSRCRYRFKMDGKWVFSTASGNYQITYSNWKVIADFLGLRDFSETSQALAALELIRRGGGAAYASTSNGLALKRRIQKGFVGLLRGQLKSALCLSSYDWASSTCSPLPASYKINYAELAETMRRSNRAPVKKRDRRRGRTPSGVTASV